MEKCTSCGAVYSEGEMFCSQCGAQINSEAPNAVTAMLNEAQQAFEQDAKVSVDRNKITYVCELCASINLIDEPNCTKCGKPRPRAEFVKALRDLRDGKIAKEELAVAQQEAVAEVPEVVEAQEPMQNNALADGNLQLFKYEGDAPFVQPPAVHQPFVIVPYVDMNQKLYQYQPKPAYKFVPYTQEELAEQAKLQQQAEAEEMLALKAAAQQTANAQEDEKKCFGLKKSLVTRAVGAKNAVLGIATIVFMFFFAMVTADPNSKGVALFKSITACFDKTADWTTFILPAGSILIALFSLIVVAMGIKKLIMGKVWANFGWIINAIAFVLALAMGILLIVSGTCTISGLGLGYILVLVATFLSLIIAIFTPKK